MNSFLHCDHLSKVASKYSRPPDLIYPYYSISKGICSNQLRLLSSLSFSLYLLYIVITINIFHWTYAKTVPIQYSSEHVAQLYRNAAECSKTNPQSRLLTKLIACFRISGMCVKPAVFAVTSLNICENFVASVDLFFVFFSKRFDSFTDFIIFYLIHEPGHPSFIGLMLKLCISNILMSM